MRKVPAAPPDTGTLTYRKQTNAILIYLETGINPHSCLIMPRVLLSGCF